MKKENYTIALDIGTNSVGYAVVYDDFSIPKKKMKILGNTDRKSIKKNFIGALLFEAGETAEGRRVKRGTRRRYTRKRQRINELQTIFYNDIKQVDASFFPRLEESFLVEQDKQNNRHPIFGNFEEEQAYHEKYPTIYHLRKALVDGQEKADLRLIYLALAHMIKYRGNFLIEGKIDFANLSISEVFHEFLISYNETFANLISEGVINEVSEEVDAEEQLIAGVSKSKKAESLLKLFPKEKSNKLFHQFLKLIVGNQGDLKKYFEVDSGQDLKIQLSKDSYEEELENLLAIIGEEYREVFDKAKNVYNAIMLSGIISGDTKNSEAILSANMVERYEQHKKDLHELKAFVSEYLPSHHYKDIFRDNTIDSYASYIEGKVSQTNATVIDQATFYKALKKRLLEHPAIYNYDFLDKMDREVFLLKQRSFANVVLPYQIHLHEMMKILDRQQQYYPFLKENREQIEQLLKFRIPYFIGPLAKGQSEYAWLVRNNDDKITPWNIEEVVDYKASAENFITRMILDDIYLPGEKVLPKASLIYQKYAVFNELTKIKIQYEKTVEYLDAVQKDKIFNQLFKKKKTVTEKDIKSLLEMIGDYPSNVELKGLKEKFNANYSTYLALSKNEEVKKLLDDDNNEDMFEDIIKKLTLFEDKKMRKEQLSEYHHVFSKQALKFLVNQRFTGWGRLSKKLLVDLREKDSHKNILDYLMTDTKHRNFMQLIRDNELSFVNDIFEYQQKHLKQYDEAEIIKGIAGNPAIKKGILQSLKIVNELVHIMGRPPKNIVIEMARENQHTNQTMTRFKKLKEGLKNLHEGIKVDDIDKSKLNSEKFYLYYLQNGKDMYSGEDLNLGNLAQYHVDHIIPRNVIKDDSIDNKVLTSSINNVKKSGDVLVEDIIKKMKPYWNQLKEAGLISETKFARLIKTRFTDEDRHRFVQRQLVETRQITKQVASILYEKFNKEATNIITLKAALVSEFRNKFDLYKLRELNDYHHAHDAYLAAVVALAILKAHPKADKSLIYGEFNKKTYRNLNKKATEEKRFYENIMKFFNKKRYSNKETGEILWDQSSIPMIKRYLFDYPVNIVKKIEYQTGEFYNESVSPKSPKGKLIPRKQQWDTDKYGGFKSIKMACAVIVKYQTSKSKIEKKLLAVPIIEYALFERDPQAYLTSQIKGELLVYKKLPKNTLIESNNGFKRYIASEKEFHKGTQFRLNKHFIKLLANLKKADKQDCPEAYDYMKQHLSELDDLLNIICDFALNNKYVDDKFIDEIKLVYAKASIDIDNLEEIKKSFIDLLKLVQTRAAAEFKFFGFASKRGDRGHVNTNSKSMVLTGQIIHQSPTGLYETRIDLEKL